MNRIHNRIAEVAQKFDVHFSGAYDNGKGKVDFDMTSMPVLPFFLALATEFRVPIENVTVHCSAYASSGCPTCGPEVEMNINVTIEQP